MNLLDKAISFISPAWGYRRKVWRDALRNFYDAGDMGRLNSGWTPVNATAEQTNQGQRDIIRARARDLERNSDVAESIISAFERTVVRTGIKVQAKVLKANGDEDDRLNEQIEVLWKEWCRPRNCDVTGQQSFIEMQQMAIRRLIVDGGIIFVKAYINKDPVPFALQAREVDELDTSLNRLPGANGNRIVGGIELDKYNRPVAYWLKKFTTDGFWTGESERIPENRVIFLWKKHRPSQIREISRMALTLPRVRDTNEFIEAVSVKERILACLAIFIKKQDPSQVGRSAKVDRQSGYTTKTISPGMIQELHPGDDVTAVVPAGQASNAKEFISTQQRLIGSGQGLSYEAVSRDMSQVNYSSARQGLLEDQKTYKMWQQFLIEHFCQEVYTEFVISAVLAGQLNIPDFWQNKSQYLKHVWIPPGWSWIDPLKEIKAYESALNTGQDTLSRICAERGEDWRDVLRQRAKEYEFAKSLGLEEVVLSKGGKAGGNNQQTQNGVAGT